MENTRKKLQKFYEKNAFTKNTMFGFDVVIEFAEIHANQQTTQLREQNERLVIGVLKVRDELSKGNVDTAYYELYRLADPKFNKQEPWAEFEQIKNQKRCNDNASSTK